MPAAGEAIRRSSPLVPRSRSVTPNDHQNFQAYSDMAGPVRAFADMAAAALAHPLPGMSRNGLHRAGAAICELDARVNPTEVNRLATTRPINWFERNLIGIVPLRYPGALRRVYQGFCAACRFYEHEPGPPRQSPDRSFLPSRQWRGRKGGGDPRAL